MSPAQVRAHLETLSMTYGELAELFEHPRSSTWRWQTTDPAAQRAITPEAAILLRLMVAGKVTRADILALDN
jgi:hypothetical protein